MSVQPTYEELEKRVLCLEQEKEEYLKEQASLAENELRYQNLFDNMLHEVHLWELVRDSDGAIKTWRLVDANPAALKSWNQALPDVVGKTTDEIFPNSNATELFMPIVKKIFSEGEPHIWAHYFPDTDQTLSMISIPMGEFFISTGLDISEQKQKEEEFKQAHLKLQEAVAAGKVGLWNWDLKTNKVTFSSEWKRQIGYEDHEIGDGYTEWESRVHPEDRHEALRKINASINQASDDHENVFRVRHKDGSYRWILAHGSIYRDENGQPGRMVGSHIDITEEKHKEELLLRSRKLLNTTGLMAKVGGWELDIDAQEVTWTEETCRIHELPLDHQPILDEAIHFFAPEDRPKLTSAIQRAIDDAEPYDLEVRFTTAKGRQLWVRTICQPEVVNGKTTKLVGALQDITEQKMSELALQDSKEHLRRAEKQNRSLLDYSPVCHKIIDFDGRLKYMNKNGFRMLKLDPDKDVYGTPYPFEFFPESHQAELKDALQKVIETGEVVPLEGKTCDSEGNEVWLSHNLIPVPADNATVDFITVVSADVTKAKRSEEEKQANEEMIRKLLENTDRGIYGIDLEGNCTFINQAGLDMLGYRQEDCLGENMHNLIHHSYRNMRPHLLEDCPIFKAMQTGGPYIADDEVLWRKDGTHFSANFSSIPIKEENKVTGGVVTFYDITDRKRAEKEKIKLEQQLHQSQKIESIGHLAGGVAHDFNNMLGVILGHAELALMKADTDNPFIEDLELIRTAAQRSADLTRQLLTFARKETITPQILNLNETVAGMFKMLQRLIGENIHLSWHPEPKLWSTKIDPAQLDQILANLCVNARDAIDGIGTITMTTRNCTIAEEDRDTGGDVPPGDYVRLSVSDDGHGIDPDLLNQIFEPFFTTKKFGEGTGLGLSTVYGAVKQNHGFIDVASERGRGTTFHIYLPHHQADVESVEETSAQPLEQGEGTILVVEDDQMLLNLTKAMLEESGYTVLDASTCDQAITLVQEHPGPIHLLLSDIVMPKMNGKDLRDILLGIRPEMEVIFMSGYTADIVTQQGVIEADTHFLKKPFSLEALTSKVQDVLGAQGDRDR